MLLAAILVASVHAAPAARPGVYHPLESGMTLYGLSRLYGVPVTTLMKANGIEDPTSIPAGSKIFVPGATARRSVPIRARFDWPLRGAITSPFGRRGERDHHSGVDIDGEEGDPIRAAAS